MSSSNKFESCDSFSVEILSKFIRLGFTVTVSTAVVMANASPFRSVISPRVAISDFVLE